MLVSKNEDKLAGAYSYNLDKNFLKGIVVSAEYRGTGAVDLIFEDMRTRLFNGDSGAKLGAYIMRRSPRSRQGYIEGTLEAIKLALGVNSHVAIYATGRSGDRSEDTISDTTIAQPKPFSPDMAKNKASETGDVSPGHNQLSGKKLRDESIHTSDSDKLASIMEYYRPFSDDWQSTTAGLFAPTRFVKFVDLLRELDAKPGMKLLDAGCGNGIILAIANAFGLETVGYELDKGLFDVCNTNLSKLSAQGVVDLNSTKVVSGDYRDADLSEFDIVYMYWTPARINGILSNREEYSAYFKQFEEKLTQLKPGARFVILGGSKNLLSNLVERKIFTEDALAYPPFRVFSRTQTIAAIAYVGDGSGDPIDPLSGSVVPEALSITDQSVELAAPAAVSVQFLRNIVNPEELTQNMIEGILSALFSNKKLTLAFSKKLKGLESAQLKALVRQLREWKESTAQKNKKMKALLDNFTVLEYDDLKAALDEHKIDANARDGLVFTYAPKPKDESEMTANIGLAIRPVYIIEEDGGFPANYYYPLLEMVTVSLAKELLQWDESQLREALAASNITADTFGIDTVIDEKLGIIIFKVLPRMERYDNNSRIDRYTRLLQFLRSA